MDQMRHARKQASLEQLRARIRTGRYDVKPERVAEAMLRRGVVFTPVRAERRD